MNTETGRLICPKRKNTILRCAHMYCIYGEHELKAFVYRLPFAKLITKREIKAPSLGFFIIPMRITSRSGNLQPFKFPRSRPMQFMDGTHSHAYNAPGILTQIQGGSWIMPFAVHNFCRWHRLVSSNHVCCSSCIGGVPRHKRLKE